MVNTYNLDFSSEAGILFNKTQTTLIQYPTGNPVPSYTIPSGVTNIGDSVFALCESLTNITIGTSSSPASGRLRSLPATA